MKKTKLPHYEIFTLLLGEIIVSAIICAVYLLIGKFDYKVITGVSLGTAVTVLNFLYLSITTTKAIDKFLMLKGEREMTEEESALFVAEHQANGHHQRGESQLTQALYLGGRIEPVLFGEGMAVNRHKKYLLL